MNNRRCEKCEAWLKKDSSDCGNCNPKFKVVKQCMDCGQPNSDRRRLRCNSCMIKQRKGENHPRWKGGPPKCVTCGKVRDGVDHFRQCKSCLDITGSNNPAWTGGRQVTTQGYIRVYSPEHPTRQGKRSKNKLEHRLVMEKKLGRYLLSHEIVHHLNSIRDDNRPENLVVTTRPEHESGTLLKITRKYVNELEAEVLKLKKILNDNKITF